jgi:type IV secretion/conjugal transfer VirB4 family ATPase
MNPLADVIATPRLQASSLAELLPWFGMASSALVICKDGSLLAGFRYTGEDLEGREPEEVTAHINRFENGLRVLNDRCTLWSVLERREITGYPAGEFLNPVAQEIDRQWQKVCEAGRNARITQSIFIGYRMPNRSEAFLEALRSEIEQNSGRPWQALMGLVRRRLTEKGAVAHLRGQLADMVTEFETILADFAGVMGHTLHAVRLQEEDLLGALSERANIAGTGGPVAMPPGLAYIDTLLAADYLERQDDFLRAKGTGRQECWAAALSTTQTPTEALSRHIDALLATPGEFVLVQCFRFIDRLVAEAAIQDAEMFYRGEVKSVTTRFFERLMDMESEKVNTGQLHLAQDAQDALVDLTAGGVEYGYYNMTLLALGNTRRKAQECCDALSSVMRAQGYTVVRERLGLLAAWQSTLPGSDATLRWKLASTANIADLAPLRTISSGEAVHPLFSVLAGRPVPPLVRFPTPSGVPLDFNPHAEDLGHTLVLGGSGGGKTSLMLLLVSMFRKYRGLTYIFDKDHSMAVGAQLLGGRHIEMVRGGKGSAAPVRAMMEANDDSALRGWLHILIGAAGQPVTTPETSVINTAIQALRKTGKGNWRLSGLYALIAGEDRHLASKLAPYVDLSEERDDGMAGPYASFFDNEEDGFELSDLVCMELGGILKSPQLASPFMDYAFWRIEQSLDGNTPALIYLEESWYMLANKPFAQKMEDWTRILRKKKGFLVMGTQALDELASLENVGALMTNIPTHILVPSVRSSIQQQAALYAQTLGTTQAQVDLLAYAIPKRDYLIMKPGLTRLVHAPMPPAILAINEATTRPHLRDRVAQLVQQARPGWEIEFLGEIGGLNAQ